MAAGPTPFTPAPSISPTSRTSDSTSKSAMTRLGPSRRARGYATPTRLSTPRATGCSACARITAQRTPSRSIRWSVSTSTPAAKPSWCRVTTSIPTRGSVPIAGGWHGWRGTIPTCRGTAASCGRRRSARMGSRSRASASPAVRTSRSSSRNGRRWGCSTSFRTAAAGGTSTGCVTAGPNRCTTCPRTSAGRSGCSASPRMPLRRQAESCVRTRATARGIWPGSTRVRDRCRQSHCHSRSWPKSAWRAIRWYSWPVRPSRRRRSYNSTWRAERTACCAPRATCRFRPAPCRGPGRSRFRPRESERLTACIIHPPTPSMRRPRTSVRR